jgi:hypothetical protein
MSRRAALRLLAGAALAAVSGCRPGNRAGQTGPSASGSRGVESSAEPQSPTVNAANAAVERAAAAERNLLAAYDRAIRDFPDLLARLGPLRADHAAHLQGLIPGAAIAAPDATSSNPASTPAAPVASSAPPDPAATLRSLADLEQAAAAARLADMGTSAGSLARLIASIGGCEAAHAALLRRTP